jgi:predicted SnoaL-like aldol condensation-catalyzing enzyme
VLNTAAPAIFYFEKENTFMMLRLALCMPLLAGLLFSQGYLNSLEVNKKVVADFYRLVFEPRNADLLEIYVAEDMIEHNPQMKNGRAELAKLIQSLPKPANDDVGPQLKNPPASITAEGDLVTYIFKTKVDDPKGKNTTYERFTFDMFRIKDGKIVEHWDGETR